MNNYSNRNYIRSISPQASTTSFQTVMLLGISLAGVSLLTVALWINFRRQTAMLDSLRTQNAMLLNELESNQLPSAIHEGIDNNEEVDQDPHK